MSGQLRGQLHTQALCPRLIIALLTPNQLDRGQAEIAVVQDLQPRMVMLYPQRVIIRIRMDIHKRKLIDHLQDKVYHKRLSLSLL